MLWVLSYQLYWLTLTLKHFLKREKFFSSCEILIWLLKTILNRSLISMHWEWIIKLTYLTHFHKEVVGYYIKCKCNIMIIIQNQYSPCIEFYLIVIWIICKRGMELTIPISLSKLIWCHFILIYKTESKKLSEW